MHAVLTENLPYLKYCISQQKVLVLSLCVCAYSILLEGRKKQQMFPSRKFDKVNDKLWTESAVVWLQMQAENFSPTQCCIAFIESQPLSLSRFLSISSLDIKLKSTADFQFRTYICIEDTTPTLSIHLCHLSSNRVKLNKKEIMQPKMEYNNTKPLLVRWTRPKKDKWRKMKLMVKGSNVSDRKRYRIYIRANHMTYIKYCIRFLLLNMFVLYMYEHGAWSMEHGNTKQL